MLSSLHFVVANLHKNGLLIATVFPSCLIWCCVCAKFSNCYRVGMTLAASYSHQYSAHVSSMLWLHFTGFMAKMQGLKTSYYFFTYWSGTCVHLSVRPASIWMCKKSILLNYDAMQTSSQTSSIHDSSLEDAYMQLS
jgi:hypothetical protein